MATTTQYNPDADLNELLLNAGASKTIYALTTPEVERVKRETFGDDGYFDQFRGAWTQKQNAMHERFFGEWFEWSEPAIVISEADFFFQYPTAGASEGIRHLIYSLAAHKPDARVHFFVGEYEGYKAMAEAAGLHWVEHHRDIWNHESENQVREAMHRNDVFFLSQPSAIDGNVWPDYDAFMRTMWDRSVILDLTYVGAVPRQALPRKIDCCHRAIDAIVFSMSKPFGAYYDRIGGLLCRAEDAGMFGNKWFKNLTSLDIGTCLLERHSVFEIPERYKRLQEEATSKIEDRLDLALLKPSDVYIVATSNAMPKNSLGSYLWRGDNLRLCVTPYMAEQLGQI